MSVGIHDYAAETSIITISPLLGVADAPEMLAALTHMSSPLILNMACGFGPEERSKRILNFRGVSA